MLFKNRHIPMIRNGEKTATRRKWKDAYNRPREGTVHMAAASMMVPDGADIDSPMLLSHDECDCYILIESVYRQALGDMESRDYKKEGGYTFAEFVDIWNEINDEPWRMDEVVDVVEFSYYGRSPPPDRDCPECSGPMIEMGDGLTCWDCGWFGIPCWGCDGWITEYVGIVKGDSVSKCPDCGSRYHAGMPSWVLERRTSP